jgi:hypothetical protein
MCLSKTMYYVKPGNLFTRVGSLVKFGIEAKRAKLERKLFRLFRSEEKQSKSEAKRKLNEAKRRETSKGKTERKIGYCKIQTILFLFSFDRLSTTAGLKAKWKGNEKFEAKWKENEKFDSKLNSI